MCGIGGIVDYKNNIERSKLEKTASFLSERGPDRTGYWIENNIGFCHTRLSIIDLSEKGNQPMTNTDQSLVITFNGEIYNFRQLRTELIKTGYTFISDSDTEVLINGYREWGIDKLLEKIDGMFAFAIYDKEKNTLLFARDRFGKKPLYYFANNDKIIFASDVKAVKALCQNEVTIDFQAMDYYLTNLSSPQPKTIWNEIKQIEPTHYAEVNISNGNLSKKKYWDLQTLPNTALTSNEILIQTENLLNKAIQKRLVSDVPVCSFLSGGIDSGLIVSLLASQSSQNISTYSVGFDYEKLNELPDAKIVAEKYGTDHHEIVLSAKIAESIPQILNYIGEPFADSSILPSYLICKEIAKDFKVAMSGDGGDELFGGYDDYGYAYQADIANSFTTSKTLNNLIVNAGKMTSRLPFYKGKNLGSGIEFSKLNPQQYLYTKMGLNTSDKLFFYSPELLRSANEYGFKELESIWDSTYSKYHNFCTTIQLASLKTRLLNDYLVKIDRASMFSSLEVRSPFLDKDLAEFAFTIPNNLKFRNFTNKYILKKIAEKYIGKQIWNKPKRGFSIPLDLWLKTELKHLVLDTFENGKLEQNGLFKKQSLSQYYNRFLTDSIPAHKVWSLFCLENWYKKNY